MSDLLKREDVVALLWEHKEKVEALAQGASFDERMMRSHTSITLGAIILELESMRGVKE